jgi:phenylacetate-CoA ligase
MGAAEQVRRQQGERLAAMMAEVGERNPFYRGRLACAGLRPEAFRAPEDLARLPFLTKADLVQDQLANPPYGTFLTYPIDRYVRLHQTSGTTGRPLRWVDTEDDWRWWGRCWAAVYAGAGVTAADRIFFAFSFGPFIGFWSALEGARSVGALAIPGGGMDSAARLRAILEHGATALCCTPTYALHLAEVAEHEGIRIREGTVRVTIHAGEPGASIPATRRRIEETWGARCCDHYGMTELGPAGTPCPVRRDGVHVNEAEFIPQVIHPETGEALPPGERGELVMTNLGRWGGPVIRYRTGDLVEPEGGPCPCGSPFLFLRGGVVGRADDMVTVRGVNVFPSAIEAIVRELPEVVEFQVEVSKRRALEELGIRIEVAGGGAEVAAKLVDLVRHRLGLRPLVEVAPEGSLPRYELKARRFRVRSD